MNNYVYFGKVRGWWLVLTSLSVGAFVLVMQMQSLGLHGPSNFHTTIPLYWSAFSLSWLMLGLLLLLMRGQTWKDSGRAAVWIVLVVTLDARVLVVLNTEPVLSDDIWRYIHDGATLGNGVNPYAYAPDDLSVTQVPVPGVMNRINNRELVTIYQPTSQYVFAALDRVWEWSPSAWQRLDPNHDKVFRFGFVLFDIAIVVLLLWQLRRMGRSAWWAAAYAWHPLAISEVAGSGHQDVIGIALLLLALCLVSRLIRPAPPDSPVSPDSLTPPVPPGSDVDKPLAASRGWLITIAAGVAFGLAIGVKPVVLPIVLILVWHLRRRPWHVVAAGCASLLTGAAIYLPFVLMDGGLAGMFDTAQTFVDKWAFNASAYDLAVRWGVGKPWVDYLAAAVLLTVIVVTLFGNRHGKERLGADAARSAGVFLFASLLVSSTVHPWYLLWALALLPLYFSLPLWVFSLTVAASYVAHLNPEGYRVPLPIVIGEYLPVYALLVWSVWRGFRRWPSKTPV